MKNAKTRKSEVNFVQKKLNKTHRRNVTAS